MTTRPLVYCLFDHCCQFEPQSHNAAYCPEHRCKRRAENARKRLQAPLETGEDLWKLQEQKKKARMEIAQAKNEWLLENSKIVFFDIETFDLAADFGLLMVGCMKERGGPTTTFVAHGDSDEKECILNVRNTLEQADYVVTYYGTGFDVPYLNTRLLIHDERPVDIIRHVDLYFTVRHQLKLNRNRLANVELALLSIAEKTAIKPGIWRRALQGGAEELAYIVDHCQRDVQILERAFDKLRGFINLSATRWRKFGGSY